MDDLQFDISELLAEDDTELEFEIGDFELADLGAPGTRYVKPKLNRNVTAIAYENAAALAKAIKLYPGEQVHCLVPGNFIFGDFIEALLIEKQAVCKDMYLSTLSMSQSNIDSLKNLMDYGYIERLTMIISNYFYSHERRVLIPYLMEKLDIDDRFDCRVIRNHTKITLMEISNIRLVLSGSSNLRSSQSVEQFVLQESPELFDFYKTWFSDMLPYSIINREGNHGEKEGFQRADR